MLIILKEIFNYVENFVTLQWIWLIGVVSFLIGLERVTRSKKTTE